MGLIKQLKMLFNKNIDCGDDIDDHVVLSLKKKYLYINKNIYVKDNTACVIVYKGRVSDVVFSGKYRINKESIPETYSRAKVEKLSKSGARVRRIRADIYYVNLSEFKKFDYISNLPFKTKSSSLGKIKGCLSGTCAVRVLDPAAAVKSLIHPTGKIKTNEVPRKIGMIIGNKINHLIQKEKVHIDMLFNNQGYVESILNAEMQEALDKAGLFVSNVKLKAIKFNKKHQKKINEYLTEHGTKIKSFDVKTALGGVVQDKERVVVNTTKTMYSVNGAMQNSKKLSIQEDFVYCHKCHKRNQKNAKICINCGAKLN